jgi:hypothetical protein
MTVPNIKLWIRRGFRIAFRKPMAISLRPALAHYLAGVYQTGEVYARSVTVIAVPGSGVTPNRFAS